MREILFRGKTWDGEWEYGSLHIETGETDENGNSKFDYRILGLRGECRYVIPETIGQFTGLTDKNGKKIFEGDILESAEFDAEDGYGVVEWYEGAFEVCNTHFSGTFHENYDGAEFEVIGNIHDNPELLEG